MNIQQGVGFPPQAAAAAAKDSSHSQKELRKACEQFEAIFAKRLLGEMRKGVQETHFGDTPGAEIYRDMMDQAIADAMSKRGALGIADTLYRQLSLRLAAGAESEPTTPSEGAQVKP